MIKGIDYVGVTVNFFCHDGQGNYVMHKRGKACRDEHDCWDFGGGGLKHGESLEEAMIREITEEYGTAPLTYEFLGYDEIFREHEGVPTHWLGFRYRVELDRTKVINAEPNKHDEIAWLTIDSLPTTLHSQVNKSIEKYKDQLK